jgi:hypothetical protein
LARQGNTGIKRIVAPRGASRQDFSGSKAAGLLDGPIKKRS